MQDFQLTAARLQDYRHYVRHVKDVGLDMYAPFNGKLCPLAPTWGLPTLEPLNGRGLCPHS